MENKHLVFVYGTLRQNERNHHLLQEAILIAEQAWTNGLLFDTGLDYPALKESREGTVFGELYEINERELANLDRLEGFTPGGSNNLYVRTKQTIHTDKGSFKAFVYIISTEQIVKEKIPLGDWRVYKLEKQSKSKVYYFAYGSCMDDERFKLANVHHYFHKVVGRGVLEGYSLRFTKKLPDGGRADIVEEEGVVEGIVYELSTDALPYLYRREGVAVAMYRPAIIEVRLDDFSHLEVLTFIVVQKDEETAPPAHYLREILRGGNGLLGEKYLKTIQEKFPNIIV